MSDSDLGTQGGDLRGLREGRWLDLSTCVNGYGPSPAAVAALHEIEPASILKHPYEAEEMVARAYAERLGIGPEYLVVGRGTTEFIWTLARLSGGSRVSVPLPAYTDFLRAFPGCGKRGLDRVDADRLADCMGKADMVIISNPSNPTGQLISRRAIEAVAASHPGCLLVIDESYMDFLESSSEETAVGLEVPNLLVLRSPSKFYGIAGVRVGVAWTRDRDLRYKVGEHRGPWPISGVDAQAASAALSDAAWEAKMRSRLVEDGRWLADRLVEMEGTLFDSADLHYRLWEPVSTSDMAERLASHEILVRRLGSGHGFKREVIRITAPQPPVRARLALALNND